MNKKMNTILSSLDVAIDRKCFELKEKQQEKMTKRVFLICCLLFITIPVTLVFIGLSLITFITWLAVFASISVVLLLPIAIQLNLEVFSNE